MRTTVISRNSLAVAAASDRFQSLRIDDDAWPVPSAWTWDTLKVEEVES